MYMYFVAGFPFLGNLVLFIIKSERAFAVHIDDIWFLERNDESLKIPKETWNILTHLALAKAFEMSKIYTLRLKQ